MLIATVLILCSLFTSISSASITLNNYPFPSHLPKFPHQHPLVLKNSAVPSRRFNQINLQRLDKHSDTDSSTDEDHNEDYSSISYNELRSYIVTAHPDINRVQFVCSHLKDSHFSRSQLKNLIKITGPSDIIEYLMQTLDYTTLKRILPLLPLLNHFNYKAFLLPFLALNHHIFFPTYLAEFIQNVSCVYAAVFDYLEQLILISAPKSVFIEAVEGFKSVRPLLFSTPILDILYNRLYHQLRTPLQLELFQTLANLSSHPPCLSLQMPLTIMASPENWPPAGTWPAHFIPQNIKTDKTKLKEYHSVIENSLRLAQYWRHPLIARDIESHLPNYM